MACVILVRMDDDRILAVNPPESDDELRCFPNRNAAVAFAKERHLGRMFPIQIVELDDIFIPEAMD